MGISLPAGAETESQAAAWNISYAAETRTGWPVACQLTNPGRGASVFSLEGWRPGRTVSTVDVSPASQTSKWDTAVKAASGPGIDLWSEVQIPRPLSHVLLG